MTLDVTGVRLAYGDRPVLAGVDLRIDAGEVVGLIGLNGAGKSSLMSVVAGLRAPDAGRVSICGVDVRRATREARRLLGMAPQDLGVYPTVTVRANLELFGALLGVSRRSRRRRVEEVASALQLEHLMSRPCRQLSGGEKRRLHTALALLHRPRVLLLDEPTVGVDVATRSQVLEVVRSLAQDGAAVCYSTHYLGELEALGSSVAVLHGGRIVERGPLGEVLAAHATTALELCFDAEPPPDLDLGEGATVDGSVVRIPTPDPAKTAAEVLPLLGERAEALRAVRFARPDLESVFRTLTGLRLDAEVGS